MKDKRAHLSCSGAGTSLCQQRQDMKTLQFVVTDWKANTAKGITVTTTSAMAMALPGLGEDDEEGKSKLEMAEKKKETTTPKYKLGGCIPSNEPFPQIVPVTLLHRKGGGSVGALFTHSKHRLTSIGFLPSNTRTTKEQHQRSENGSAVQMRPIPF